MFTILGADGKEYGPVTAGKLHEWIAGGRANMQTQARREGEAGWKTLGDFPEFSQFGTTGNTTPPAIPALPVSPFIAPPTASLELEPATRLTRLGAILLDNLIGTLFLLPAFTILFAAGTFNQAGQPNTPLVIAGYALMGLALLILLSIQIYLLTTRGQTMGKKLMSIKIVSFDDETNPGFVRAFLLRTLVNGLFGAVPFIGALYTVVDICFIFRDDRRCLHDLLANTKVVKA